MSTLSEAFADAGSDTITHRGRVVKALVRLPVRDGSTVTVRRVFACDDRPQGIKLAVDHGSLAINDTEAASVVLWNTTAPDEVELRVSGAATSLEVWNCWSMGGVDTSWVGNAGIVTKTTAEGTLLRCSDGIGEAEFSDLEILIDVDV